MSQDLTTSTVSGAAAHARSQSTDATIHWLNYTERTRGRFPNSYRSPADPAYIEPPDDTDDED